MATEDLLKFRVLELFSGIGGMHFAFKYSSLPGIIVSAIDINTIANVVYAHNHHGTPVKNKNIQSLNAKMLENLNVNMLLMSPPCQPHTRVGHQLDIADNRSDALTHICTMLPNCYTLKYILLENVKGFESSQARQCFINALETSGFYWREFILSPSQFDVPNTRHRYYCLARKKIDFNFGNHGVWTYWPIGMQNIPKVYMRDILENDDTIPSNVYLTERVLEKRVWLLDIVNLLSENSICFTKAYTHYSEGTGSVFTILTDKEINELFAKIKILEKSEDNKSKTQRLKLLKELRLRYFTPREVANLMSFPNDFNFPPETTLRQKYRLLGNSINIRVVGELIKLLCA